MQSKRRFNGNDESFSLLATVHARSTPWILRLKRFSPFCGLAHSGVDAEGLRALFVFRERFRPGIRIRLAETTREDEVAPFSASTAGVFVAKSASKARARTDVAVRGSSEFPIREPRIVQGW